LNATLAVFRSRDRGRSWHELGARFETTVGGVPGHLGVGELVEAEPGRLLLIASWMDRSDPTRPMFDPVTQGILRTRQLAAYSADDGETWSSWRELDVAGLKGCSGTGPILKWSDGAIAYPFESFKEFDDPQPGVHGAWLMISRDHGRTFGKPLLTAQDPRHRVYYWDQRLCIGKDPGEFVALFWTHDLEAQRDLNVHLRRGWISPTGLRLDAIADTGIPGQIGAPLLLDDGRLLAFVVDRGRPATMTLWLSPDGGTSWPEKLVVYLHDERAALTQGAENIDFGGFWEDMIKWTFGHPAIRPLGGGRVLLAYYAGIPNCTSMHWARVAVDS